jgi:hypothetical protein
MMSERASNGFSSPTGALSLSLGVRPPRLGILVPMIKGLSWPLVMECALASQCQIWGGQANLPLPMTPGFEESELFWALADRLDADTYVNFSLAAADLEHIEPKWHREQRAQIESRFKEAEGEQWPSFWDEFQRQPVDQVDLDPAFERQLVDRLGTTSNNGGFSPFTTMDEPHWPWGMDVAKLGRLPEEIVDLQVDPRLGAVRKLLATTTSGRIAERLRSALEAREVRVRRQVVNTRSTWTNGVTSEKRGEGVEPWGLSEIGLAWYRTGRSRRSPAVLVVGNSPWDFTLFYALRRWTSQAWWLPSWLMRDGAFIRQLALQIERLTRNSGRDVLVTTTSTVKQRDRVARELEGWRGPIGASVARWQELLPDEPGRYFEHENMGRPSPVLLLGEETPALSTPLPDSAPTEDDHEMRWMVEARVDDWSPIRASSLLAAKSLLAPSYEHGMVRASRYGLAYFNPDVMTFSGQALASNTVRPKQRPLTLLEQLETRLEPHGWKCKLSDKGIYASQTIELFGGVEQACAALRDPLFGPLLNAYQRQDDPKGEAPGRFLRQDQRRYLSLRDIQKLVGATNAGSALEQLLKRRVLIRGLSLKCRHCRQEGWYGLDEFSQRFRCRRCSIEQTMSKGWWLGVDEPAWLYRLAEVVHQFLKADGDLPLLAAWDRFGQNGRTLALTNELEFKRSDGIGFETDIVLSNGHELWLGEATSSTDLEPLVRLDQLGELAELVSAYGVLLVTSATRFKSGVRKRFDEVFNGLWPKAEVITAVKRGTETATG